MGNHSPEYRRCAEGDSKRSGGRFSAQGEEFYRSALASTLVTAKPILIYYCFLNLAKAFVLKKKLRIEYARAQHGLQESVHPGGIEFTDSFVKAYRSKPSEANVFDDLQEALFGKKFPSAGKVFDLQRLLPQLVQGHRVWCEAAMADERFVEITRIDYLHDEPSKSVWLVVNIFEDDLTRFGITRKRLLAESGLGGDFKLVASAEAIGADICLGSSRSHRQSTGRPSDKIADLVRMVRPSIWTTVMTIPPYRKHYVPPCPPADNADLMDQPLSIYACFFTSGSITRYRPHMFELTLRADSAGTFRK
ncbi:MAG: hypothetical protein IPH30_07275 [Betaproteobacteria bacterium]|nr:hypothetical protein [Betaproteobacteria bacterium]